ncbi:50S ribosomal protein L29 [Candidatus Uhrbacteria bacterium]|nr:50S ribosomal protein L29 [Candidatus Uhrbacteria bacterium]
MDVQTLRAKNTEALVREMEEAQIRLQELRFHVSSSQLKDVREIRELKRTIARIKTLLVQGKKDTDKTT